MLFEPPGDLIKDLQERYAEPQRAYHTWAHIEALLRHFEAFGSLMAQPTRVLWALYWHDAVYDPKSPDNEVKSAALLREQAEGRLTADIVDGAALIIEATATHEVPEGLEATLEADLKFFLDIDLSILGQPADIFQAYEEAVRIEYSFVDWGFYKKARQRVLEGFLARDQIYFCEEFRRIWEAAARTNLARSIKGLQG